MTFPCPGHEHDPACPPEAVTARQPAVKDFHSATARMSASSVTCACSSSVVCTSAFVPTRDTTCTGTPAISKAVACDCLTQCGVHAAELPRPGPGAAARPGHRRFRGAMARTARRPRDSRTHTPHPGPGRPGRRPRRTTATGTPVEPVQGIGDEQTPVPSPFGPHPVRMLARRDLDKRSMATAGMRVTVLQPERSPSRRPFPGEATSPRSPAAPSPSAASPSRRSATPPQLSAALSTSSGTRPTDPDTEVDRTPDHTLSKTPAQRRIHLPEDTKLRASRATTCPVYTDTPGILKNDPSRKRQ